MHSGQDTLGSGKGSWECALRPESPRGSGPFSVPPLFAARGHRLTLGGRPVPRPRHALSRSGDTPQPPPPRSAPAGPLPSPLPPAALPCCHAPSLPPLPRQRDTAACSHRRLPPRAPGERGGAGAALQDAGHNPTQSPSHAPPATPRRAPHTTPHTHRRNPTRRRAPTRGAAAAAPTDLGAGRGWVRARQPGRTEGHAGVGRPRHAASEGRRRAVRGPGRARGAGSGRARGPRRTALGWLGGEQKVGAGEETCRNVRVGRGASAIARRWCPLRYCYFCRSGRCSTGSENGELCQLWALGGISWQKEIGMGCPGRWRSRRPWRFLRKD